MSLMNKKGSLKRSFAPERLRANLEGTVGYEFDLASPFEDAETVGGLASSAHAFLNSGIACVLVGLDEPAHRLFSKAYDWLVAAISEDERPSAYFAHGTEALRLADLALLNWLLEGIHDSGSQDHYVQQMDRYFEGQKRLDRIGLLHSLVNYIAGGYIDRAFELVQKTKGLSAPRSRTQISNEAHVVHVLKEYGLDSVEGRVAVRLFLDRSMGTWLANGHFGEAANWVKIAYWSQEATAVTPVQVVLQCYRHLPNCEPP